jgi:glycosyltransferase involved in cell wall biosynthesis
MALGKTIIATYEASFEEVIKDGQSGFLVKAGDPEDLSFKILECLARDDLEKIGYNAYESVLRFDITKIAQDHIEFYRSNILDTN